MQIRISYFGQLKNFKPWMIPISTAVWNPKWFKGKDSKGVYLGLNHDSLVPGPRCENLCRGPETCGQVSDSCAFLNAYYRQLQDVNFPLLIQDLESIATAVKKDAEFTEEPVIVLMVYETPDNPCSERKVLKKWFADNKYDLQELKFD